MKFAHIMSRMKSGIKQGWKRHGPTIKKVIKKGAKSLIGSMAEGKKINPLSILGEMTKQAIVDKTGNNKLGDIAQQTLKKTKGITPSQLYEALPKQNLLSIF